MSVVLTKHVRTPLCAASFIAAASFQKDNVIMLLRTSNIIACRLDINGVLMFAHLSLFQSVMNSNSFVYNDFAKSNQVQQRCTERNDASGCKSSVVGLTMLKRTGGDEMLDPGTKSKPSNLNPGVFKSKP